MNWGDIAGCLYTTGTGGNKLEKVKDQVATLYCIPALVANIVFSAVILAAGVVVIFIIVGGYKYMTSGGDPKQLEGARKTITYAIIGMLIVFFSLFFLTILKKILGIDCLNFFNIYASCISF